MEKITAYRFRGTIYATREDALKEIDRLIGVILCKHARALANLDKYAATLDYLEANAEDFHEVHLLREDMKVIDDD